MIDTYYTRLSDEEKGAIATGLEYIQALFLLKRNGFALSDFPCFNEYDFFYYDAEEVLIKILTLPDGVELVEYDEKAVIVPGKSAVYLSVDEDPEVIYNIVAGDEQKAKKLFNLASSLFGRTVVKIDKCDVTVSLDRYEIPFLYFPAAIYVIVASRLIKK